MKRRAVLQSVVALAIPCKSKPRILRRIHFKSTGNIILDEKIYPRNIDAFVRAMQESTWVLPTTRYPVYLCGTSFAESSSS